jgi:coenzyme F420-reducing hydrogenase gamma subunit
MRRVSVAVVKLTSCSGCINEFLYAVASSPELLRRVTLVYATEFQDLNSLEEVDVALVEGSVATQQQEELVKNVRGRARLVVALGTCAVFGGVQAARVGEDLRRVILASYPNPDFVSVLPEVKGLDRVVRVDVRLPGCPVNGDSLARLLVKVIYGGGEVPIVENVCSECKRAGVQCAMVSKGVPCLGPVTFGGCGAICPSFGRGCYGCYGLNTFLVDAERLARFLEVLERMGMSREDVNALLRSFSHSALARLQTRG